MLWSLSLNNRSPEVSPRKDIHQSRQFGDLVDHHGKQAGPQTEEILPGMQR